MPSSNLNMIPGVNLTGEFAKNRANDGGGQPGDPGHCRQKGRGQTPVEPRREFLLDVSQSWQAASPFDLSQHSNKLTTRPVSFLTRLKQGS
jgi:hypothetical protein